MRALRPEVSRRHRLGLRWFVAASRALALAAIPAGAALPAAAHAAPKTVAVHACQNAVDWRSDAWKPQAITGQPVEMANDCAPGPPPKKVGSLDPTGTFGFWATTPAPIPTLTSLPERVVGYRFEAPGGATIASAELEHEFSILSPDWEIQVTADDEVVLRCAGPTSNGLCAGGDVAASGSVLPVPAGSRTIDVAAYCVAPAGCRYGPSSEPIFSALFRSADVALVETEPPFVEPPVVRGRENERIVDRSDIVIGASDDLGVERMELLDASGVAIATRYATCLNWSTQPCTYDGKGDPRTNFIFIVGEVPLATGRHTLRVRAIDPAGNATLGAPFTIVVRETLAPATNLGGGGRSPAAVRTLTWNVPGGMDAVAAQVELCPNLDGAPSFPCVLADAPPGGPYVFSSLEHPDVFARVRLTSYGGARLWSESLQLTHDPVAPRAPVVSLLSTTGTTGYLVRATPSTVDDDLASWTSRLCRVSTKTCTPLARGLVRNNAAVDMAVTAPAADYRLEVTFVDLAGNAGPAGSLQLGSAAARGAGGGGAIKIGAALPKRLRGKSMVVRGTVPVGSTGSIAVVISGRTRGKKAVRVRRAARLNAKGVFTVRVPLPKGVDRKKGVVVAIVATPPGGGPATTVRKRIRR